MNPNKARESAEGLRAIADLIDSQPTLEWPDQTFNLFVRENPFSEALKLATVLGGDWEDGDTNTYHFMRRRFGSHAVEINIARVLLAELAKDPVQSTEPEADPF